jgi:hypothetical protein
MRVPGVVGVAAGERGGTPRILVLVDAETPEIRERLPSALESVPVEIRPTGGLSALDRGPSGP